MAKHRRWIAVSGAVVVLVALVVVREVAARRKVLVQESFAAIALANIGSAQRQFRKAGVVDLDGDRRGEFAFLQTLSGAAGRRGTPDGSSRGAAINPALLNPRSMSPRAADGLLEVAGHLIRVYLPSDAAGAIPEPPLGESWLPPLDTDLAEDHWCAYAWPASRDQGTRVFYIDETGEMWQRAEDPCPYLGPDACPPWEAALPTGMPREWTTRRTADGPGNDGGTWTGIR